MQKPFSSILLLVSLLFFAQYSFACSCAYVETFCESQTFGTDTINAGLIVYGKKLRSENGGIRFEVFQVLHGPATDQSIFIRDGNGADCGMTTDVFDSEKEFILSLWPGWTEDEEQETQYMVSICGQNVLEVESGVVKGKISPGINSIPIEEFHTLSDCGSLPPISAGFELQIGPNPADSELKLKISFEGPFKGSARVINSMGQEVKRYVLEGVDFWEDTLRVSDYAAGLYFMEVELAARRKVYKIVIQHL